MIIPNLEINAKRFWDNKMMDTEKVTVTHHVLKGTQTRNTTRPVSVYGKVEWKVDQEYFEEDLLIVGTELQQYRLLVHLMNEYGIQVKDSWDFKMEDTFKKWYIENNNKPYTINLN